MVKKAVTYFLSFLFMVTSVGLTVYTHYCPVMGGSVALAEDENGCCGGEKEMEGCCEKDSQQIKITDPFATTSFTPVTPVQVDLFTQVAGPVMLSPQSSLHNRKDHVYHPPPGRDISLSILYRSILV